MIIPFHALPISREETDFKLNEDEFKFIMDKFLIFISLIFAKFGDIFQYVYFEYPYSLLLTIFAVIGDISNSYQFGIDIPCYLLKV